jgi:predicted AAA+ superfamily ATPase
MVRRTLWLERFEQAWQRKNLIWLMGVRRVGKTMLVRSIAKHEYLDCELPSVRRAMADPEAFWKRRKGRTVVIDEVHRLDNPAETLKIAADHYPAIRVLATGSSTLGASAKFRDTLAGRKTEVWLTPMNSADLQAFGGDLDRRLLHGGLPPFYLSDPPTESDFQEWMDAYWAKDIQELFRVERRHSFERFAELLFAQSGGMFEASGFARDCEVSRPTIANYLSVMESTFLVHVLRPFSSRKAVEIVSAPKVYAFDTGFVCCFRGWTSLRRDDYGPLWEHYVLNEILACVPGARVQYWRDKQKHEIDFVLQPRGADGPVAIECKWKAASFDPGNLSIFRRHYPKGSNFVVTNDVTVAYSREYSGTRVEFIDLAGLIRLLRSPVTSRRAR